MLGDMKLRCVGLSKAQLIELQQLRPDLQRLAIPMSRVTYVSHLAAYSDPGA